MIKIRVVRFQMRQRQQPTPPRSSKQDLGKKHFTIFSDFTSNIHRSPKKLQDKKSYSQFLRCNVITLL
jgi:hypothetical protein